jgi:prolyl-tRNA synthetase
MEIGPKDLAKDQVVLVPRDTGEKRFVPQAGLRDAILSMLEGVQQGLYDRALRFREDHTHTVDLWDEFRDRLEGEGGFLESHWCGSAGCEERIKRETRATIRCMPLDDVGASAADGACITCGNPSPRRVLFARAY